MKQTFEEKLVELIGKDKETLEILNNKVRVAIKSVDVNSIVAEQVKMTIESIFENEDDLYSLMGESIKDEIKCAIVNHFKKGE